MRSAILGLMVAGASSSFGVATLVAVGTLSGGTNTATLAGLSSDGSTAYGYSSSANGTEAFRWRMSTGIIGLGDLAGGGFASFATGSNTDGSVIVGRGTPSITRGFRWNGVMAQIAGIQGGTSTSDRANAMSADGSVVVGFSNSLAFGQRATKWTGAGLGVILPDLAGGNDFSEGLGLSGDGSVSVGWSYNELGKTATRWVGTTVHAIGDFVGGPNDSYANAASFDGSVIVGRGWDANGATAFRWTASEGMQLLGDSTIGQVAFNSEAFDVSSDGLVIVGRGNMPDFSGAFVWTAATGMKSVKSLLSAQGVEVANWSFNDARGVSDDGRTIAGNCVANGVITGYVARLDPYLPIINGTVILNDTVASPDGQAVVIKFWQGGIMVGSATATLDSSGRYSVVSPVLGEVQISIEGTPFLHKMGPIIHVVVGATVASMVTLTNGDCDGSGEVDATDIDLVIAGFGLISGDAAYSTAIDVDRSSEVDASDIDVVIANFGATDE